MQVVRTLEDLADHAGGCLQFGPGEDFDRYPRTLDSDLEICRRHGAAAAWIPSVEDLYPDGPDAARDAAATLDLPTVATSPGLEDRCRPGHFAGVAGVVARLFDLARPGLAVFGEKDFQQLRLIEELVEADRDRRGPRRWAHLRILRGSTVRESDGLAMSSRNRYLADAERTAAVGLSKALQAAHAAQHPATAESLMQQTLGAHGLEVEYVAVRDPVDLMPVRHLRRPTRALIAAKLGTVRLIDNAPLPA
ncbi:MAG: 4-phosphopantoate--beta-alanine ligase, partial [Planctomycetota bacterium]